MTAIAILVLLSNLPSGQRLELPLGITIDTREPERHATTLAEKSFTIAALMIGLSLPWLFAHRAVRPGWRAAISAALELDLAAIVFGSFLVAVLAALLSGAEANALAASLMLGALGLVILGIPMLFLVFWVAVVWLAFVRLAVRVFAADEITR